MFLGYSCLSNGKCLFLQQYTTALLKRVASDPK